MIAVTCPAGQVSILLVPRLLRRGHPVRVLCHSAQSIDELTALGAQVRRGDLCVQEDLYPWLRDAVATFLTIPIARAPDVEAEMGRILARALANSAVMHVLLLSLAGCDRSVATTVTPRDSPPRSVAVKAEIEQVLADLGRDFTFLRTGLRMEGVALLWRELELGRLPLPIPPTARLPMVSVLDIAQAALRLVARGPVGAERVSLLGPALVTPEGMAADLSDALEHRIEAEEVSAAEFCRRLSEVGIAPERAGHIADVIGHMAGWVEDPTPTDTEDAWPDHWTPTSFSDFARTLAGTPAPPMRP